MTATSASPADSHPSQWDADPRLDLAPGRIDQVLRLSAALSKLPKAYADVIRLRYFERLSVARIAERTGTSADRVAALWVRALARLRAILGEP